MDQIAFITILAAITNITSTLNLKLFQLSNLYMHVLVHFPFPKRVPFPRHFPFPKQLVQGSQFGPK